MQQYVVPQYIDVEDKIIGPITIRQFIIILFAILVDFLFYKLLLFIYFIIAFIIWTGFWVVVAFTKINGQSFHYFLLNVINTFKKPTLRVWQPFVSSEDMKSSIKGELPKVSVVKVNKERPTQSRLSELSLLVNTGGVYKPEI